MAQAVKAGKQVSAVVDAGSEVVPEDSVGKYVGDALFAPVHPGAIAL